MQLNKVLKGLMIALSAMATTACSSNKNVNNDGSEGMLGVGIGMDANGSGNMSFEEQARLQMQQLQQNNTAYFDLDEYGIRSDFATMLDVHVNFLHSNPSHKVTVEDHVDERGTPEYSISLGERRVNAVKMYLQGKGVSADQVSIVSHGREKPAVPSHDEAAYAKNRRAVLVCQENCMSSNFRHHLSSLSLLTDIAAPWAAFAQASISSVGSGSAEDRVTQLERIFNAHSQFLTQPQQQPSDNQSDIDSLRGQIQENQYQLNQAVGRQKQILLQMNNLGSGSAPTAQAAGGDQSGAVIAPALDAGAMVTPGVPVQTGDVNTGYNAVIALVQDRFRQDDVIEVFQNFIKKYLGSTHLPNTNYWPGQLGYNKGKKDDAAFYLASVVKNSPKSPKAADAMYKVGVIMQDKGDKEKTKAVYQQVITKYPGTDGVKQAQERLGAI